LYIAVTIPVFQSIGRVFVFKEFSKITFKS
jgi:hypothetical protein